MSYQDLSPPAQAGSKFGFLSIRTLLVMLIIGIMVPMLCQVAVLAWYFGVACQQTIEAQRLDVSTNIGYLIDREIQGRAGYLSGVGLSPSFEAGQPETVRRITEHAIERGFEALALFDSQGQLQFAAPAAMEPLFAKPERLGLGSLGLGSTVAVSDFLSVGEGRPSLFVVSVPITIDGKLKYILSGALTPKRIQALFADPQSGLRDSWAAGVVDRKGIIIARSQRPEAFVGVLAQKPMVEAAAGNKSSGVFDVISRDGISIVNTYLRSQLSGWTVGVAVPSAIVNAPLWESMFGMLALALGLTLIAVFLAIVVANRIARAVHQLGRAAVAFAAGDVVPVEISGTANVEDVSQALEAAASTAYRREARQRG
jgi:hypothetical protein